MRPKAAFVFDPAMEYVVNLAGEDVVCYEIVDEYAGYPGLSDAQRRQIVREERDLLRKAGQAQATFKRLKREFDIFMKVHEGCWEDEGRAHEVEVSIKGAECEIRKSRVEIFADRRDGTQDALEAFAEKNEQARDRNQPIPHSNEEIMQREKELGRLRPLVDEAAKEFGQWLGENPEWDLKCRRLR